MKVKFVPQNVEAEITPDKSVLHLAQDKGLYIKSVCRGFPSCAECRVRVVEGVHNVVPPGSEELQLIGTAYFVDGRRLSCQLKCFGDMTVDLTEQVEKEKHMSELKGHGSKSVREAKAESSAVFGNLFEGFQDREEKSDSRGGGRGQHREGGHRDGGHRDGGHRDGGQNRQGHRDGGNREGNRDGGHRQAGGHRDGSHRDGSHRDGGQRQGGRPQGENPQRQNDRNQNDRNQRNQGDGGSNQNDRGPRRRR